ncbi:hypothetical protein OBBRIDRAFT_829504 [Obba rivulosa]|uniref:DUF6533 domain-containing protein n=1 Tax=Obba rivulosa TaxID=1052685 RepID=A0A8E2DE32_9APHY|nr:hypothetical protein OBBRIDRAFT_829504 [Obba rivulosa]
MYELAAKMDPAALASQLYQSYISELFQLASCVIVLHEYAATFEQEMEAIWSRKLTNITSILFLLNRYNTLFQAVTVTAFSFFGNQRCWFSTLSSTITSAFVLVSYVVWAAFSALRVYSIDGRNLHLGLITLVLGLVPFGTNLYGTFIQVSSMILLDDICIIDWNPRSIKNDIVMVVTHASLVLCDILVLYATLSNIHLPRRAAVSCHIRASIMSLLIRDGILYFSLLLLLNCTHIVLWVTGQFEYISTLTIPIYSIIISRFILTLRTIYLSFNRSSIMRTQYAPPSHISTVHFTSFEAQSIQSQSTYTPQVIEDAVAECRVDLTPPTNDDPARSGQDTCQDKQNVAGDDYFD